MALDFFSRKNKERKIASAILLLLFCCIWMLFGSCLVSFSLCNQFKMHKVFFSLSLPLLLRSFSAFCGRKFCFDQSQFELHSLACVAGWLSNWKSIKRFIFHNRVIAIYVVIVYVVRMRQTIYAHLHENSFGIRAVRVTIDILLLLSEACLKSKSILTCRF